MEMNETTKFRLYDDDDRKSSSDSAGESGNVVRSSTIVYVDVTKPLPQMIEPVRSLLENKPDGYSFGIYIVAGEYVNPDVKQFVSYLRDVIEETYEVTYYFRGLIHPEYVGILLSGSDCYVAQSTKVLFKLTTLHDFMKSLMIRPEVFRKFIQRYIDAYSDFPERAYLDVTELDMIGLTFKKF